MPLDHPDLSTPAQSPRPEAGLPLDGPPPKPPALFSKERPAFREIFLRHFPPLVAESLREAGRHLRRGPGAGDSRAGRALGPSGCARRGGGPSVLGPGSRRDRGTPVYAGLMAEELDLAAKVDSWVAEAVSLAEDLEAAVGAKPRAAGSGLPAHPWRARNRSGGEVKGRPGRPHASPGSLPRRSGPARGSSAAVFSIWSSATKPPSTRLSAGRRP